MDFSDRMMGFRAQCTTVDKLYEVSGRIVHFSYEKRQAFSGGFQMHVFVCTADCEPIASRMQ
jgi:hypothetical protein